MYKFCRTNKGHWVNLFCIQSYYVGKSIKKRKYQLFIRLTDGVKHIISEYDYKTKEEAQFALDVIIRSANVDYR